MANAVVHWEIGGRDLDSMCDFYRAPFGWQPASHDEDYRLVVPVDGVGGRFMRCKGDVPRYATVYVAVDDLGATLARAKDPGGTPLMPPTPIPGVEAFALFQDPEQSRIGILQPAARAVG